MVEAMWRECHTYQPLPKSKEQGEMNTEHVALGAYLSLLSRPLLRLWQFQLVP
jgi:hypothetical protein